MKVILIESATDAGVIRLFISVEEVIDFAETCVEARSVQTRGSLSFGR